MKFSDIELPSNRKFGFFFVLIFAAAAFYFYNATATLWACSFTVGSLVFLVITVVKADMLLELNKLWMRFGLLLGMIISPIILGLIFFGIFTPVAFFMRLGSRDELRLKVSKKPSHWILRNESSKPESFRYQF